MGGKDSPGRTAEDDFSGSDHWHALEKLRGVFPLVAGDKMSKAELRSGSQQRRA